MISRHIIKLAGVLTVIVAVFLSSTAHANDHASVNKLTQLTSAGSHVQTSRELPFSAWEVWDLIAGFNTLSDYHAAVPESRLSHGGSVRHLTISEDAGGGVVVERLMQFDEEAKTFSYRIIELIESPMPFRNYQAWVRLEATGTDSCTLYWSSRFDVEGGTREEAEQLARDIYGGCYDGIEKVLSERR